MIKQYKSETTCRLFCLYNKFCMLNCIKREVLMLKLVIGFVFVFFNDKYFIW